MEMTFMDTENNKMSSQLATKIRLKKHRQICYSSKLVYLLQL